MKESCLECDSPIEYEGYWPYVIAGRKLCWVCYQKLWRERIHDEVMKIRYPSVVAWP